MSQIKLQHSGGNSVIIAAPSSNPASDRTLTLPGDADGSILTSNSTVGKVVQTVNGTYDTQLEMSTSTVTDTGLSVSITTTGSNKVIILVCQQMSSRQYNSAGFANGALILTRVTSGSATDIYNPSHILGSCTSSGPGSGSYFVSSAGIMSIVAEDSPGAGTHIYKTRLKHETRSGTTTRTSSGGHPSEIQVLEIAA